MSAVTLDGAEVARLRALLDALSDGTKQIGSTKVVDPATGRREYLGDLAEELLDVLDDAEAA